MSIMRMFRAINIQRPSYRFVHNARIALSLYAEAMSLYCFFWAWEENRMAAMMFAAILMFLHTYDKFE